MDHATFLGCTSSFIINYCYKIPKLHFELDHYGNIFITKNTTNPSTYPCIVTYIDSQSTFFEEHEIVKTDNKFHARYIRNCEPCALNADCSNGILIALQLLEQCENLKVCFTVEGSSTHEGARQACYNKEFFSNVNYIIQVNETGCSDIACYSEDNRTVSNKFSSDIKKIAELYAFKLNSDRKSSDVGIISKQFKISGINISTGFYKEDDVEYCSVADLKNCLNLTYDIVCKLNSDKIYKL